jgi:hypothetical protein
VGGSGGWGGAGGGGEREGEWRERGGIGHVDPLELDVSVIWNRRKLCMHECRGRVMSALTHACEVTRGENGHAAPGKKWSDVVVGMEFSIK